jgi:hypothetical protein
MKLGPRLLVEIMKAVQEGFAEQKDISGLLREVEVDVDPDDPELVELSSYLELRRGGY